MDWNYLAEDWNKRQTTMDTIIKLSYTKCEKFVD